MWEEDRARMSVVAAVPVPCSVLARLPCSLSEVMRRWSKLTATPRRQESRSATFQNTQHPPARLSNRHAHHVRSLSSHEPAVGRSSLVPSPSILPMPLRLRHMPDTRENPVWYAQDADMDAGKSRGASPVTRSTATGIASEASTTSSPPWTMPSRAWARA